MSLDNLKSQIPAYAKDIKLNLSSLANEDTLTPQQLWGTFFASALASGNAEVIKQIEAEAADNLSAEAYDAAKAAAAIMGMNNIYYRFAHLASNKEYSTMPAKLRMNIIGNPGVEKADFELWSLAVSAINGCGMCIDAHEAELRKHGLTSSDIQAAVRIASVVHAAAAVLDGELALNSANLAAAA
ncbi:MAG: alkyl hydroperoxide reductase [Micavibrio sp.]|nr:alkyl hydroperoxide reductase [Micavibrio sp.]|tara:strand:- start:1034 stop:1588 length:555 start_codon:yes stop_codon:yes gene_type:complete